MKPVDQDKFGKDEGNCFSACLASLFEIPLSDVPNFFEVAGSDNDKWWKAVQDWVATQGWGIITFGASDYMLSQPGYLLVAGMSPRGLMHATIWKDGKLVHDPHPSKGGIERPKYIDLLYPLDPVKFIHLKEGDVDERT